MHRRSSVGRMRENRTYGLKGGWETGLLRHRAPDYQWPVTRSLDSTVSSASPCTRRAARSFALMRRSSRTPPTYPQYVTMLVLWEDPGLPRSIGELGERLHLDSGTLTPLLKRLAAMGYVTRARDAEDERRVLVTVTAEGLALRDRLAAVPESFLACLGMDVADTGALRDQLTALTASLEAGAC